MSIQQFDTMQELSNELLCQVPDTLRNPIENWFMFDRNEETRREVISLVEGKHWTELHKRFDERLAFGTAGLRSKMEAGFNRINTLVVLQATQGLATYVKKMFPNNLVAVVGHDHRYHSKEFADVTVATFLGLGFKVYNLNGDNNFVHTPLVPFAVDHYKASMGVMITASHNPKVDNGYKVYYSNGCQIIPPHDENIANMINDNLKPWPHAWDYNDTISQSYANGKLILARDEAQALYVEQIRHNLIRDSHLVDTKGTNPWFVYTAMHGVGAEIFNKVVSQCLGLDNGLDYLQVPEQCEPDPAFPTVDFPNPEEKGALDLAIQLATSHGIDFVLANDPDADRFSVAIFDHASNDWVQLTGNQIGFLFAYYEWQKYQENSAEFKERHPLAFLSSTVSSQMIKSLATKEGFFYAETLTGFKWIGNRAKDYELDGYYVPYGYEEAIGYMFSKIVHDKDGISAATVFLQALSYWKNKLGLTPLEVLTKSYKEYGFFSEYNGYYVVSDPSVTDKVFDQIRQQYASKGLQYPSDIGGRLKVTSFRDLTLGFQSDTEKNLPTLPVDGSSQMITVVAKPTDVKTNETVRFTIRGSGTEPKLKVYIEARSSTIHDAALLAHRVWDILKTTWFKPEENGLTTNF